MRSAAITNRDALVARGRRLEYLTIAWNGFEAAVALVMVPIIAREGLQGLRAVPCEDCTPKAN